MRNVFSKIGWAVILFLPGLVSAQTGNYLAKTEKLVNKVIEKSFPELKHTKITVEDFQSDSNYFKSQFSVTRFLMLQTISYKIFVNPEVFARQVPESAVEAILAHELSHILYYKRKNRLELVGLISLMSDDFAAKFERRADLEAIKRGYGEGLIKYRRWLYQNIPAQKVEKKKRNYFSPEEIELMLGILRDKPAIIDVWQKNVPRNLKEIAENK